MQTSKEKKPTDNSPYSIVTKLLRLALPMAASYSFSFMIVSIGVMTGRLSDDDVDPKHYLSGTTLITSTTQTLVFFSISALYAMSIVAGSRWGKLKNLRLLNSSGDLEEVPNSNNDLLTEKEEIEGTFKSGIFLSAIVVPLPLAGMYFSESILSKWFGQSVIVASIAQRFLRPFSFSLPAFLFRICCEQMLFTFEQQFPAMVIGLSTFSIGTGLAYFLAFTKKMGIEGIAYGYLTEAYLTPAVFALYLKYRAPRKDFSFFMPSFSRNQKALFKELLKTGLPITLQISGELAATYTVSLLAGKLGTDELAAMDFATQLSFFIVIPVIAFGQASAQEISRQLGGENFENARQVAKYGLLTSVAVIFPFCALFAVYPKLLTELISNSVDDYVLHLAKVLVPITAAGNLFDILRYGMVQQLRPAGDLNVPTILSVSGLWFGVLLGYLLGFNTSLEVYGLGIGYNVGIGLVLRQISFSE